MSCCIAMSNAMIISSLKCGTQTKAGFQTTLPAMSMHTQRMSVHVLAKKSKSEEREASTPSPSTIGGNDEPRDFWEVSKTIQRLVLI